MKLKKVVLLLVMILLFTSGCGKVNIDKVRGEFEDKVNKTKSYNLNGTMEIMSNEDTYSYTVEVSYLKGDFYKVRLVNQTNNHEQYILKNQDAVYVVTPSLNKSFKFQSEWPGNSSQSYILKSLLDDIKNDKNSSLEVKDDKYIIKAAVNYPNNSELVYEKIYFDKSMNLETVEVYSSDDVVKIKVNVKNIDMKANNTEKDFVLEDLINGDCCNTNTCDDKSKCQNEEKTNKAVDDIIYPLYIPSETYLTSKDVLNNEDSERVILTYKGNKNFVLIEEDAIRESDFEVVPVYGEPHLMNDTVAALQTNSVSWTSNNRNYYLTGNNLTSEELLNIATSLGTRDLVTSGSGEK